MYITNNINGRIIGFGNTLTSSFAYSFFGYNYRRAEEDILQIDFIVKHIKR